MREPPSPRRAALHRNKTTQQSRDKRLIEHLNPKSAYSATPRCKVRRRHGVAHIVSRRGRTMLTCRSQLMGMSIIQQDQRVPRYSGRGSEPKRTNRTALKRTRRHSNKAAVAVDRS